MWEWKLVEAGENGWKRMRIQGTPTLFNQQLDYATGMADWLHCACLSIRAYWDRNTEENVVVELSLVLVRFCCCNRILETSNLNSKRVYLASTHQYPPDKCRAESGRASVSYDRGSRRNLKKADCFITATLMITNLFLWELVRLKRNTSIHL